MPTDYVITDGAHTPDVYVRSVDKLTVNYTSGTGIINALTYSTQTAADADASWLNIHFGDRFGVHSHPH